MEKIQGYLKTIVFESNGFRICKFSLLENVKKYIHIKGQLINLQSEQLYELYGNFTSHSKYGKQFEVSHYNPLIANHNEGLTQYFSSSLFPGVGKKTALKIINELKEDIIEKILNDNEILYKIGIKSKQAEIIYLKLQEQKNDHELVKLFSQANLPLDLVTKLKISYRDNLLQIITNDPYSIIYENNDWNFKKAEKLKSILNIKDDSISRLVAAIHFLIKEICFEKGDSFVSSSMLLNQLKKYCTLNEELVYKVVSKAVEEKKIIVDNNNFYDFNIYYSEINIAERILKLQNYENIINEEKFNEQISKISKINNITYDEQQISALKNFYKYNLTIINGGPGTGKTTLIKALIQLYKLNFPNRKIAVCAPTGRATKRLKEQTEEEAMTIHKFLKWDLHNNKFQHNEKQPLNFDLIIIDEMSMVDTILFNHLLLANINLHKLVLVGDPHQLPSINSGNVLLDLIKDNWLNIITLKQVYRQKEKSEIINLAYQVKQQNTNYEFKENNEVFFVEEYNSEDLLLNITNLFINLVEKSNILDVQILASMYNGCCGIISINEKIQEIYNPFSEDKPEFKSNNILFRLGDKVMQNKNDSEKDIYNGDMGIIKEIVKKDNKVVIRVQYDNRLISYEQNELNNLILGYTISVHKSQGSEYPFIIMVLDRSNSYMLKNNLIYTAITRAQKQLYLLGQKTQFYQAIKKIDSLRLTTLNLRIKNFIT